MSLAENNKLIAKNTIVLYIRIFFTMSISFYTSRVVLNSLGIVDYGIYNLVGGIVGMMAVLNDSMAGATQRWITIALGKNDKENLIKVFSVGLTAQSVIVIIVLILCETIGLWYLYNYAVIPPERLKISFWVFQISIVTLCMNILNVPFWGTLMAHEKMSAFALFSVTDVLLKLIICFVLSITAWDKLLVYSALLFVSFLINVVFLQIYCHKKFIEARIRFGWDKTLYKEMLHLALLTISANLATMGYTQGITLLTNMFFGPVMNAAAGIASQAGNIVNQFSGSFQTAINPQITKNYATKNYNEMHKLVFRSAKFSYFLMLFFTIPLFFEADILMKLWLKIVPDHAVNFLRIGLFVSMFMAVRNPLVIAAIANGHIKKYQSVIVSILLLILPISYSLLKLGGIPETTSIVLLCIMIITVFASAFMLKELIRLNFNEFIQQVIIKIIIVTLLSFCLPFLIILNMDESIIRLITLTVSSTISSTLIIYFLGLTISERQFTLSIINNKLKRIQ